MYPPLLILLLASFNLLTFIAAKPLPNQTSAKYCPAGCQPICPVVSSPPVTIYITSSQETIVMPSSASQPLHSAIASDSLDCQPADCPGQHEKAVATIAPLSDAGTTTLNIEITDLPKDFSNYAKNNEICVACSSIMVHSLLASKSQCSVTRPTTRSQIRTITQTTSMILISTLTYSPTVSVPPPVRPVTLMDCQADNCLRALEKGFPAIAPFCFTYTKIPHNSLNVPLNIINCGGNSNAISSACSCVMQPSTIPTLTSPPALGEIE